MAKALAAGNDMHDAVDALEAAIEALLGAALENEVPVIAEGPANFL
jgi:hypothetical protein